MTGGFEALDQRLFFLCYRADHGVIFVLMSIATCLGSGFMLLGLLPFVARHPTRRWAIDLLVTIAATATIVFFAKLLVHRPRPAFVLAGVRALFDAPRDFSFPSGHAAGSFAFACFASLVLRARHGETAFLRLGAPALLFTTASLVALSRVVLGCHFPADVVAGAVLGTICGAIGARRHLRPSPLRPGGEAIQSNGE